MDRHRAPSDFENSFEAEFRALFAIAFRVARRILGDPASAEDVAAETLSRTYAHWSKLRETTFREAWVVRVATNQSLTALRRRRPEPQTVETAVYDDDTAMRLALAAALDALPSRQRDVIVLRHLVGLSEPEVAEQLGLSLGTVKTHLRRAKSTLRGALHPDLLGYTP